MNWVDRAIERPRLVFACTILACIVGVIAAATLPRERTPRVRMPVVTVIVPNPSASPNTNESQVVDVIEREAASLDGLRSHGGMISEARHGSAIVRFQFSNNVDSLDARRDVESLINRVQGDLPAAARSNPGPSVEDVAFEDWPLIQILIAGGESPQQRRRVARGLRSEARRLPGVSGVDMFGDLASEVLINVDQELLSLYRLTRDDLIRAVQLGLQESPAGVIETGSGSEIRVQMRQRSDELAHIRRIPIDAREGSLVVLEDVAEVQFDRAPASTLARFNGEDATVLLVRPRKDADLLATARKVGELVEEFNASGKAEQTTITTGRSLTRQIQSMLHQLGSSAAWGALTILVLLTYFLGWRNSIIIISAVPMALLATAAALWLAKRSVLPDLAINNMVLFAVILVTGLVVDGSIIVGENICRHRESGLGPLQAAQKGVAQVGPSLITAHLTTLAAFAPMLFIGGVVGEFLGVMPIVVLFALIAALLIDHIVLPVLSVRFMQTPSPSGRGDRDGNATLMSSDREIERQRIESATTYAGIFRCMLRRRAMILTAAFALMTAPIVAIATGMLGLTFFPESDIPIVEVHFELPPGSSLNQTATAAELIERSVMEAVRTEEWYQATADAVPSGPVTTLGEPGALNTNLDGQQGIGPEYGMIFIELVDARDRARSVFEIRQAIESNLPMLPGVLMHVRSPSDGPPAGAPVVLRVIADEHTSMETIAARSASIERLLTSFDGASDVRSDLRHRLSMEVSPNQDVAALMGVNVYDINQTVSYALDGQRIAELDLGTDEPVHVRVQGRRGAGDARQDLEDFPLRGASGKIARLGQVASVTHARDVDVIRHYDGRRVVNIRADLRPGVIPDDIKQELITALRPELSATDRFGLLRGDDSLLSDAEVTIDFGGENEARDEALADLHTALLIAVGAMVIILLTQFNSIVQVLIVLGSVPMSIVGVVLGLIACGLSFSISSMIGLVALSGIVVNDAIVLVEFYNRLRHEGQSPEEAAINAGRLRLRPILLTTMTTIAGLIPLSLNLYGGGEFWQPLAITIMSGLAGATLLQLFIVPLMCCTFCRRSSEPRPCRETSVLAELVPCTSTR